MIKLYHEAPLSMFDKVQQHTHGDYALVHLFEESTEYYLKFVEAIDQGREVILDNSIFELGVSFDMHKFASWIKSLRPAWYIVPDVLDDHLKTMSNMWEWHNVYDHLPGKPIGVVQGQSDEEVINCFKDMVPYVSKIAISFNYVHWNDMYPDEETVWHSCMKGRINLIDRMIEENVIRDTPVHLLGCGLPQEFAHYKSAKYSFIDSLDTSNPVMHGMHGVRYGDVGLTDKITNKMADEMFESYDHRWGDVLWNIKMFALLANGTHSSLTQEKK